MGFAGEKLALGVCALVVTVGVLMLLPVPSEGIAVAVLACCAVVFVVIDRSRP